MDAARDAGLRVAFSLKDVFYHGTARNGLAQITSPAEEERYFKQRVRTMRNHSAMLAYYTNGEFQVTCCRSCAHHGSNEMCRVQTSCPRLSITRSSLRISSGWKNWTRVTLAGKYSLNLGRSISTWARLTVRARLVLLCANA